MSTTTTRTQLTPASPEGRHSPNLIHGPIWKVVAGGTALAAAAAGVYLGTRGESGTENRPSGTTTGAPANPGTDTVPTANPNNPNKVEYNRGDMRFPGYDNPVDIVVFKADLAITGVKRYPDPTLTMIEITNKASDSLNRLFAAGISGEYLNPGISPEDMKKYNGLIDEAMRKALFAPNQSKSELARLLNDWLSDNSKLQETGDKPDIDANLRGSGAKGYHTVMLNGGETFELEGFTFSLEKNSMDGKPVETAFVADMIFDPDTGGFVFGANKQIPNSNAS